LYGSFHFSIHKTKSFITQDWEYFFVWFFSQFHFSIHKTKSLICLNKTPSTKSFGYAHPLFWGLKPFKNHIFSAYSRPRFGRALAKCRSLHQDQNRKRAISFLRMAKKASGGFDNRKRVNNMWIRCANLEPVIQYLSQR